MKFKLHLKSISFLLFGLILSTAFLKSNAQVWPQNYGGTGKQFGCNIIETYDRGYLICGNKQNGTHAIIWLVKTDVNGDTLWSKEIGNWNNYTYARKICKTTDGFFLIIGATNKYNNCNAFVLKIDACGNQVWFKLLGGAGPGSFALDVKEFYDGSYLILTNYVDTARVSVFRLTKAGDLVSRNNYDHYDSPWAYSLLLTSDNGYLISGSAYVPLSNNPNLVALRAFIIKIDSAGNEIWNLYFLKNGGLYSARSYSVQFSDSSYLTTGCYNDLNVFRTNKFGNAIAVVGIPNSVDYDCWGLIKKNDSTVVLVANHFNYALYTDDTLAFFELDKNGSVLNVSKFADSTGISINSLDVTYDHNYIGAGWRKPNSIYDMMAIKINGSLIVAPFNPTIFTYDSICPSSISFSNYDIDTTSVLTSIQYFDNSTTRVSIFPNPLQDRAKIVVDDFNDVDVLKIKVFDLLGNDVTSICSFSYPGNLNQRIEIEFSRRTLVGGTYILRIYNSKNFIASAKLILM